jgi:Helix-turn-helix of insertion element transposase
MPSGAHMIVPISDFRKQRFLHWLCTPPSERDPSTMEALAEELGLTRRTLTNWKDDKEFLEAWEKLYLKTIGNPEVKMRIMKTLERTATDPDDPKHVQAAKTYFEIEGSVKPARMEVQMTQRPAKELSDEQLAELIALNAQAEKDQRSA